MESFSKPHFCDNVFHTDTSAVIGGEYINASFVDVSKEAPEVIDPLCV